MDIVQIVAIVLAVFLVFLAISNWRSKSRDTTGFYHDPYYDRSSHTGYAGIPGEHAADSNDRGDWGARDMSHDHHGEVDSGGGGDWGGGDAGGGEGGGGGE